MHSENEQRLKRAFKIVGIDENKWNNMTPEERKTEYKTHIKAALLKFHPDKRNKNYTEEEERVLDENIRLVNLIEYNKGTTDFFYDDSSSDDEDERQAPPAAAESFESFFQDFKTSLAASIGQGEQFENWQKAYEHYFVFDKDNRFANIFRHKIKHESPDYQQEFDKALREGIYKAFVLPGARNHLGATAEFLPFMFRRESALLVKIIGAQRDTGYEQTAITVAHLSLLADASFWRAAVAANPKTILSFKDDYVLRSLDSSEIDEINRLADDESFLNLSVQKFPIETLSKASERLRNISERLAGEALLSDIDSIQYVNFDAENPDQVTLYQSWVKQGWDTLRQNEATRGYFDSSDLPRSRMEFIVKLKEPFQQQARKLYASTAELIVKVSAFIKKNQAIEPSSLHHTVYNFFAQTLRGPQAKQLEVARRLLDHLENRIPKTKDITEDEYQLLGKTPLKEAITAWKNDQQSLFSQDFVQQSVLKNG